MPVISTDVLEMLKGLGLDEARALRAATAVGMASDAANASALTEIGALRHAVVNLSDRVSADAAAQRAALDASLAAAAEAQARALNDVGAALRAEIDAMRRAVTAAETAQRKASEDAAASRRMLAQLSVAAIILVLLGILVSILT